MSLVLTAAPLTSHWGNGLQRWNSAWADKFKGDRSTDLAVLVAFSGGGTRAAAFVYSVLQELAATKIVTAHGTRALLYEIDMISSVSGGSFTAAYYGLHGEQIFTDFEPRFLRQDVEGILLRKLFNPLNWARLLSRSYGRSDLAANNYDEDLVGGGRPSLSCSDPINP
jgi:NTE family protein